MAVAEAVGYIYNMKRRQAVVRNILYTSLLVAVVGMLVMSGSGQFTGMQMLAGQGMSHSILLVIALVTIAAMWLVRPPRPLAMRALLGTGALILTGAAITMTLHFQMGMIDCLICLAVAIVAAIEALEMPAPQVRRLGFYQPL